MWWQLNSQHHQLASHLRVALRPRYGNAGPVLIPGQRLFVSLTVLG